MKSGDRDPDEGIDMGWEEEVNVAASTVHEKRAHERDPLTASARE